MYVLAVYVLAVYVLAVYVLAVNTYRREDTAAPSLQHRQHVGGVNQDSAVVFGLYKQPIS